jgi:hypothetical protein
MAKTKARPRRQERNSNYSSIAKKRIKPKCNFEGGCTNIIAVNGGVCKTHGGANNVTKKKKCTFENMYQWSRQGWSMYHAWRTRKAVQSSDAETRDVPRVLLRGGVCWTHGANATLAKKRKCCTFEECTKYAQKGRSLLDAWC